VIQLRRAAKFEGALIPWLQRRRPQAITAASAQKGSFLKQLYHTGTPRAFGASAPGIVQEINSEENQHTAFRPPSRRCHPIRNRPRNRDRSKVHSRES